MCHPVDDTDIEWLHEYEASTLNHFRHRFEAYQPRFARSASLLTRYSEAVRNVIARGRNHFHSVDEAHNEICVADAILSDPSTLDSTLLYEPTLPNTEKTIDFILQDADGKTTLVDVKTIKPQSHDRWDQYQRAINEGWLPNNVQYVLQQEWQGGELWHTAFASRARFLEYTLEFEDKLIAASFDEAAKRRILMLCGEGFHWRQDELEDFVAYYTSGAHRYDDPFALAEARHIQDNNLAIRREISSFGCLDRRHGDIVARRINWHVQPPPPPVEFRNIP